MKCPIDQTEMEKGNLTGHGTKWIKGHHSFGWFPFQKTENVTAYKCPKCGKVELTTEVK